MYQLPERNTKAFTLVELSIVIVIVGLIIAGITAGKSLVRSAQLRSITSTIENYTTAIRTFKMQYDALPGDIKNFQSYFPAATGNGNSNNRIEWPTEAIYLWQHLNLAKLIPGTYPGVVAYNPGVTFPKGSIPNSGYYLHVSYGSIAAEAFPIPNHVMFFGAPGSAGDYGATYNPVLTATEAMGVDTKSDDGKPYTGKIRIRAHNANTCAVGAFASPNNAAQVTANQYNIGVSGTICNLAILMP